MRPLGAFSAQLQEFRPRPNYPRPVAGRSPRVLLGASIHLVTSEMRYRFRFAISRAGGAVFREIAPR